MNNEMKRSIFSNTGKRLLITFCLDVSPSMGNRVFGKKPAITVLNETVSGIIAELSKEKKLLSMIELMFVTFCTDIVDVHCTPLSQYEHIKFVEQPVGGSDIPYAVLETFSRIDARIGEYQRAGVRYHSPIFVLISDGNPDYVEADDIERQAIIIGIGDELNESTQTTMAGYAKGFMDGYFHIMGDDALQSRIAKMIVKLFTCSVRYVAQSSNNSARSLGEAACEMNRVQNQINETIQQYRSFN